MSRAQVWDGTQWVDISCSGGGGGFTYFQSATPTAAIRYNAVWPLVARVTQAQQDRIDSLETTVAEQGEQIAALTARLDALG